MPKISAGLACPICDAQGVTQELYQITPNTIVRCESGNAEHVWTDTNVLRMMNPRKLAVKRQPDQIQPNHVSVTLSVPSHTVEALKTKFGERLPTSLSSVLQACAEPRMILLSASDLERLEEKLGPNLTGAADLFGRIFALNEEKKSTKDELERLMRRMNIRRDSAGEEVVLELGDFLPKAVALAADSGQELNEFLSSYVRNSLENDWITV